MTDISRFALVNFTPQQMFDLVRDVARYPDFLGWVRSSDVHEDSRGRQLATLEVAVAGMVKRFTTENELLEPELISMRLYQGPFDDLSGTWRFQPLGESGTRVSLDLHFAMRGSLLALPFRRGFGRVADGMVDDFCRRAEQVHG